MYCCVSHGHMGFILLVQVVNTGSISDNRPKNKKYDHMIITTDTGTHLTNFKQISQCIKNKRELPQPLKASTKNLEFTSDLMVKD